MANELEVMRVLRVMPLGKLVVDVGGGRYQKLSDVPEEEIRRRLIAAIGELIVFAGGYQVLLDAGVAPPLGVAATQAARAVQETADPNSLAEQQARFLQSLEKQRDLLAASKPVRSAAPTPTIVGPADSPVVLSPAVVVTPPAKDRPLTIIEQIDQILQKHLAMDPQFARRDIGLESALSGGMRIRIDGNYYDHPTAIPEKQIQLVIKMALKEWDTT